MDQNNESPPSCGLVRRCNIYLWSSFFVKFHLRTENLTVYEKAKRKEREVLPVKFKPFRLTVERLSIVTKTRSEKEERA